MVLKLFHAEINKKTQNSPMVLECKGWAYKLTGAAQNNEASKIVRFEVQLPPRREACEGNSKVSTARVIGKIPFTGSESCPEDFISLMTYDSGRESLWNLCDIVCILLQTLLK